MFPVCVGTPSNQDGRSSGHCTYWLSAGRLGRPTFTVDAQPQACRRVCRGFSRTVHLGLTCPRGAGVSGC